MSAAEIMSELPKLNQSERRAIARRVFELEDEREELDWATQAADAAFQMLDKLEDPHAPPATR
jgi:hypothetical protein